MLTLDTVLLADNVMDPLAWMALADAQEEMGKGPDRARRTASLLLGPRTPNPELVRVLQEEWLHFTVAVEGVKPATSFEFRLGSPPGVKELHWVGRMSVDGREYDKLSHTFPPEEGSVFEVKPGRPLLVGFSKSNSQADPIHYTIVCHPLDLPEVCG